MWRDLERVCAAAGLPFRRPDPFPQSSLLAARVALALQGEARAEFSRKVFAAEFGEGLSIAHRDRIAALIEELGLDPEAVLAEAESDANKARLKSECARAFETRHFRRAEPRHRRTANFSGATTGWNRASTGDAPRKLTKLNRAVSQRKRPPRQDGLLKNTRSGYAAA